MGNYWRRVFARAWADTKQSFGWNQKTVATALVALAGLAVAFIQLGIRRDACECDRVNVDGLAVRDRGSRAIRMEFLFSAESSVYGAWRKDR
jgi:hypothetical protein